MLTPRKAAIAARFGQARDYDRQAHVQRICAELVARKACALVPSAPNTQLRILELGCGTGFLSAWLRQAFPAATLWLTDLSPEMLQRTRQRLETRNSSLSHFYGQNFFHVMDGENPEADETEGFAAPFDLIISSLCLQWFEHRPSALQRLCQRLVPGGLFIAATLLQQTLQEWRDSCEATRTPCGLPDWPALATLQAEWPDRLGSGNWEVHDLQEKRRSGRDFLQGLRAIGAALPRPDHRPVSAAALRRTLAWFDTYHDSVTYQIGLGTFRTHGPISSPASSRQDPVLKGFLAND
ncbi:methyltransferase [Oecophyllibacter saccharovorans]|uniref:methyltransferase n=1 Tax=Oecophyllibacter saccharovorans TaxID=2558360 RepID=UPI001F4F83A4|nr:methyltransferase [Oecophyllibacter saccharovorans]